MDFGNRMNSVKILLAAVSLVSVANAEPGRVVLGRVGQTTTTTPIFAAPNTRSRVFYQSQPYEYLVVRSGREAQWVQVLLKKGIYGYAARANVKILPYEVTANGQTRSTRGSRSVVASRSGSAVANYAQNFIGTPYKWGGNDVKRGIDCSGFVKNMYGAIGVQLPRTASEQALVGTPITRKEYLVAGDRLYFWEKKRNKIGHTGIYLGNGYFIHSSNGHGGIATDYLTQKWQNILVAARR